MHYEKCLFVSTVTYILLIAYRTFKQQKLIQSPLKTENFSILGLQKSKNCNVTC